MNKLAWLATPLSATACMHAWTKKLYTNWNWHLALNANESTGSAQELSLVRLLLEIMFLPSTHTHIHLLPVCMHECMPERMFPGLSFEHLCTYSTQARISSGSSWQLRGWLLDVQWGWESVQMSFIDQLGLARLTGPKCIPGQLSCQPAISAVLNL